MARRNEYTKVTSMVNMLLEQEIGRENKARQEYREKFDQMEESLKSFVLDFFEGRVFSSASHLFHWFSRSPVHFLFWLLEPIAQPLSPMVIKPLPGDDNLPSFTSLDLPCNGHQRNKSSSLTDDEEEKFRQLVERSVSCRNEREIELSEFEHLAEVARKKWDIVYLRYGSDFSHARSERKRHYESYRMNRSGINSN